jgi:hypothetical protein
MAQVVECLPSRYLKFKFQYHHPIPKKTLQNKTTKSEQRTNIYFIILHVISNFFLIA